MTASSRHTEMSHPPGDRGGRKQQDIGGRLQFMQLDANSCASIRTLKSLVERELPVGLDKFYAQLRQSPEVKRFFSSEEHIARAKGAQMGHWTNISNGDFGDDYVQKIRTIGTVHARIGLEPQWYIGGYAIILDHLITAAVEQNYGKGGMFSKPAMKTGDFAKALASLVKAVMLDMDLAISVYIDEAEIAKKRLRRRRSSPSADWYAAVSARPWPRSLPRM
ncbi:Methyl-accepting chemotaxis protein (plasmid) [Sinorhizobium sojae CCBAU 05684]|uniref:Methyl-accepting chemotaxis protein n=1 Tax=Sinorhizobium sojae CCBAU 05684 TaxID=716928 RepID=A0A249PL85_9HYPH|nr:protoglobin domain-containing protein [Sinorhizobium sojae]ASY66693.1 Methyl-accepting chemotaxis protein [Sinorhizobium sojae CCBAU 05684]